MLRITLESYESNDHTLVERYLQLLKIYSYTFNPYFIVRIPSVVRTQWILNLIFLNIKYKCEKKINYNRAHRDSIWFELPTGPEGIANGCVKYINSCSTNCLTIILIFGSINCFPWKGLNLNIKTTILINNVTLNIKCV